MGEDTDYKHLEFQCLDHFCFILLILSLNIFKGNRDAVAYTKTYVSQWDSIKIVLPTNLYDFSSGEIPHRTKVLTGDGKQKQRIYASFEQYYITQYKKYFKIIWIVGGIDEIVGHYQRRHDAAGIQCQLMRPNMVLSVYVNRKQWKDKSYGTKEKPMPVFLHRIISGDDIEERNKLALWRDSLQPGGDFVDFISHPRLSNVCATHQTLLTISLQNITCVISYPKTSLKDCLKKNNLKVHYDGK